MVSRIDRQIRRGGRPRAANWTLLCLFGSALTIGLSCNDNSPGRGSASSREQASTEHSPIRKVSGLEAKEMVKAGALLLDVRTPAEFSAGYADGAKNVPLSDLKSRIEELDTETPIVVYCRSGRRSQQAALMLRKQGFRVADLGSLSEWPD